MVEIADRPGGVARGREDVVERACLMVCAVARVRVAGVVEELIFQADYVVLPAGGTSHGQVLERCVDLVLEFGRLRGAQEQVVLNAVLDAAVAARRDLPIEGELEIAEDLPGKQILGDAGMGRGFQAAVFNGEGIAGGRFAGGIFPIGEGLAVEKQPPAGGFLLRRKLVIGSARAGGSQERTRQRGAQRHGLHPDIVARRGRSRIAS